MAIKKEWVPKVGDRVVSTSGVGCKEVVGVKGTIKVVDGENSFLAEFDEDVGGHDGWGVVTSGRGWWCNKYETNLVDNDPVSYPTITITTDGKTTTATINTNGDIKTATAKCHEDDEFDYLVGAQIALERVMKKEEKKFEIGMRVKDTEYYFDEAWVTLIDKCGDVFITPPRMMGDVLRNGAKEHKNCYCINSNYEYTTIIEDEEED